MSFTNSSMGTAIGIAKINPHTPPSVAPANIAKITINGDMPTIFFTTSGWTTKFSNF